MRKARVGRFAATLCLLFSIAVLQAAMAGESVRAYVLIETAPGTVDTVIGSLGLGNCKALTESLWHSEIIAHIQCNDLKSLNTAITDSIAQIEGVSRTTTWIIVKSE